MLSSHFHIEMHERPKGYRTPSGQEFIGVIIEVRVAMEIKLRLMCRWMLLSLDDSKIYVDCPAGCGISEELRVKVGKIAQKAIVDQMTMLERRALIDAAKNGEGRPG